MKNDNKEFEHQPLQTINNNDVDEDDKVDYDFGLDKDAFLNFFETKNKTKNKIFITRPTTTTKQKILKRNKSRNDIPSFNQSDKKFVYEEKFDEENSNGINKLNPSINVDDLDNLIEKTNFKYLDNKEDELQNKLHPNPNQDIISHSREPIIPIFKPYQREDDDPNFQQAQDFQFHDVIEALKPKPTDMDIKVFNALCEMCQSYKNDYELLNNAYKINQELFPNNDTNKYFQDCGNNEKIRNTYLNFLQTMLNMNRNINKGTNQKNIIDSYSKTNQYLQQLSEQLNNIQTELTKFDAEQIAKDLMRNEVRNYIQPEIKTKIINYMNTQNKNLKIDENDEIAYYEVYKQLIKKYSSIGKYNQKQILSFIKNFKQNTEDITSNTNIIDEIAKNIAKKKNNNTLYCKIVNDHNKKRISNRKIDYQKCFGKRGWVKY